MAYNTPVDAFTTQQQIEAYLSTLSQKYLGNNEYIVSGTNTGYVSSGLIAVAPYGNLSNRYYPTVAGIPEDDLNLQTRKQLGGYFVPSNLGASIYLAKHITYTVDPTQVGAGSFVRFIDPTRFNKGSGLTTKDQPSIVTHTVNVDWIKASGVSDYFDGNPRNADTYQKFIPYQSAFETKKTDSNGVINARYDFEFFTGTKKQTWASPTSATSLTPLQYFDINARILALVITPGQEVYSWSTDVFGNQYTLYKSVTGNRSLYDATTATGALWAKTIDGTISQGPSALNLIYNNYRNTSSVYSQLTANNIVNFEAFFDTLVIQLTGSVHFEKISFNYNNYAIQKSLQNFLPIVIGTTNNVAISTSNFKTYMGTPSPSAITYYGGTWYNANEKTITVCTLLSSTIRGLSSSIVDTGGLSSMIVPALYRLDLNKPQERVRIFPTNDTPASVFIEYIYPLSGNSGRTVNYMEAPVFCYNEDTRLFFTSFITFSSGSQQLNLQTYKNAV